MAKKKKYFHDHVVLLLLSVTAFIAVASSIYFLIGLASQQSPTYIVQCRDCSNLTAVDRFVNGSLAELLALVVFAVVITVTNFVLSLRLYRINRQLAVAVLALGVLLVVMNFIVGGALLGLR